MPVLVGLPSIGTIKGLPTKRLKGALETTLDISEQEGMGPLPVHALSVPGTKTSLQGVRALAPAAPAQGKENRFLRHAELRNGLA